MKHLKSLLQQDWRFRTTPGDGFCGIWALLTGLEAVLQQLNLPMHFGTAWHWLETYLHSPQYWNRVTSNEMLATAWSRVHDFLPESFFTDRQLNVFAQHLTEKLFPDQDWQIVVIIVTQNVPGQPLHTLLPLSSVDPECNPLQVFIHHSDWNRHYQAFTPAPRPWTLQDRIRIFKRSSTFPGLDYRPGQNNKSKNGEPATKKLKPNPTKIKHPLLPRGRDILYITGQTDTHPWTGEKCPFQTPLRTKQLANMFDIADTSVIRHAYRNSRAQFKDDDTVVGNLNNARKPEPPEDPNYKGNLSASSRKALETGKWAEISTLTGLQPMEKMENASKVVNSGEAAGNNGHRQRRPIVPTTVSKPHASEPHGAELASTTENIKGTDAQGSGSYPNVVARESPDNPWGGLHHSLSAVPSTDVLELHDYPSDHISHADIHHQADAPAGTASLSGVEHAGAGHGEDDDDAGRHCHYIDPALLDNGGKHHHTAKKK